MGFLDAILGTAEANHGTGQAMHEASQHNMAGRQTAAAAEGGSFFGQPPARAAGSDAQMLVNDAANEMGYNSWW